MNCLKFLQSFFITVPVFSLLISCSGSKRAAVGQEISSAKELSKTETTIINKSEIKKSEKLGEEKIDSTISANINNKLREYSAQLDSFKISIYFIDSVIKSNKLYRKNKGEIGLQLKSIRNYSAGSYKRLRRFEMIDNGLTIAEQHLFNLAAFFGPGKYEIPAEKLAQSNSMFTPILDSVAAFYNKYTDIDKFATLRIIGFADGIGFNKNSSIYDSLTSMLADSLATKQALNSKLSELRAKKIADVLDEMLAKKIDNYTAIRNLDFLFLETGKGEAYPSKKISDYKEDDERRRVVLIFWNILPK
jgi:outer membrane protein OmpA-like peptidoglycan-associated protein